MKFYSEELKKLFDSEKELVSAEKKFKEEKAAAEKAEKEKKENRAKRAAEVELALKEARAAQKKANDLLTKFCNDYGTFHSSTHLNDLFDCLFF